MSGKTIIKRASFIFLVFVIMFSSLFCSNVLAGSDDEKAINYNDYVSILYNSKNGMPTSESNDIIQTPDGFIWIASYSGLIKYDGRTFDRMSATDGVASANKLFVDSKEQLWIGTNDNGVMKYADGEYTDYNTKNGLLSNSVKNIQESSKGILYIGTTAGLSYINESTGKVVNLDDSMIGKAYINSMAMLSDDTLIVVTNTGDLYYVNGTKVKKAVSPEENMKSMVTSVYFDKAQKTWYYGTQGNLIYKCKGEAENFKTEKLYCNELSCINSIYDSNGKYLWVCADNGIGYFYNGRFNILKDFPINNSVDSVMEDYEGNMWFTSSRQGVVKMTKNCFTDIGKKAGLGELVVNSTAKYEGNLYVASDTGLYIVDDNYKKIENQLTSYMKNVRIRNLLVDSKNNLWLSTYGETGLVCYDGKSIKSINEKDGLKSGKVRSAIEAGNGNIYAATANGIYIIKDEKVQGSITEKDGLTNPEVLCMYESENGTLCAGTDGGGVCIIKDGKVTDVIDQEDGMHSNIIMRIRYDEEKQGLWFVTSNSIAFYKDGKVKTIEKFPYSNNLDIYFGGQDTMWVLSSNGLYVVNHDSMFSDKALAYTFYDYNSGMPSTPTANSFSDIDGGTIYMCGTAGVFSMNMNIESDEVDTTKLALPSITADGETIWIKDNQITIPADVKRVKIDAYALSYGFDNPLIEYYLEGFDDEKMTVRKSDFPDVVYTNLSGGNYVFHISVIDPNTDKVLTTKKIRIKKEVKFTESVFFPFIMVIVGFACISGVFYVLYKFRLNKAVIEKEEEQKAVLKDALDMAKEASAAKGQFLSKMSHEIRTPLNAVIGYMSIAKDSSNNPEKVQHCIENSEVAAKHLLSIINDVLDISSIESGKMKIAYEDFDLKKQISSITTIFFNQAKEKKIYFDVKVRNVTTEWVVGDSLRVNQILMNLLSNAMKFTPVDGNVVLSIEQVKMDDEKVYMKFEVSDTGIGMSEEYQSRLFQPFEQENATTARKYGGTGLGLSISHNLVQLMGGAIDVDSTLNKGTTFTVSLPFGRSSIDSKMKAVSHDYSKVRALIVDDDADASEYMKGLLKRCHVKCDAVDSGAAAFKQIKRRMNSQYKYDLCIIDWKMPDMNGIEVAKKIKEEYDSDIPIFIASAYDVTDFVDEAREAGIDRVIAKPFFQSTMLDLLVSTFGKYTPKKPESSTYEDFSHLRILLAEDNEMNMEIALDVLRKAGTNVDPVYNGQEAYEHFIASAEGTYDAILMDVQMPILDGYSATEKIRESDHHDAKSIPIIAMTANAFAEDITAALNSGMNDHISKPIDYDKLFTALRKIKKENV